MNASDRPGKGTAEVRHSGSFDEVSASEQMKAIGEAMRHYFQSDDWLRARRDRPAAVASY